jgi:hypothetical protein
VISREASASADIPLTARPESDIKRKERINARQRNFLPERRRKNDLDLLIEEGGGVIGIRYLSSH